MKGYSTLIILEEKLTKAEKSKCLEYLDITGFEGYDYNLKTTVPFNEVINGDEHRTDYLVKFGGQDFVIFCSEEDDFLTYRIDHSNKSAGIMFEISQEFCDTLNRVSFGYIDVEGDSPKNLYNDVKKAELKWLFKHNYFGKNYLDKFGRAFFENFPCEHREYVTDDIIRIDLCADILSPLNDALKEKVMQYCSSYSFPIKFYNPKKFMIN